MTRATAVQLRNPRTIHRRSYCGFEARLYAAGKLCDVHAPKPARAAA
jgi:hypothetical protein